MCYRRFKNKNQGLALIGILIAVVIILLIINALYFRSTKDTKNVIETKKQAEEQIEAVQEQLDKVQQQ